MDTHYDIIRLPEVGSTQDVAVEEAERRGRPVLVIADRQVSGRGRQGRAWIEPDQGLYSSFSFTCPWPADARPLLALCTAVAVRRTVSNSLGIDLACKWPNDLLLDDRKVVGILPDSSGSLVTIGCGVNLAWADPPDFAAALLDEPSGHDLAPTLAIGWVDELRRLIDGGAETWPRAEYEGACVTLGRDVSWEGGSGTAVAIGPNGHLLVDGPEGRSEVIASEVHLLPRN